MKLELLWKNDDRPACDVCNEKAELEEHSLGFKYCVKCKQRIAYFKQD